MIPCACIAAYTVAGVQIYAGMLEGGWSGVTDR